MPTKIALDSFLAVAKRSNLLTAEQLKSNREAFVGGGGDATDARSFADYLVKRQALTRWQAEKLLQGKHKGFFLGKYKLLSLLGKGGMSSVYLAEHVLMRRRCAIKVLPTKRVHDTSYLGRFHREAQAVAALDDPNIVRAYDVDHEVDGDMEIHFLVMEYVDGKSLLALVQDEGAVSPVDAADYIRQAALGLAHAHQAGLVHRDIKPGNLLVDKSGTVKLLDLGLARFFAGSEEVALTIEHDEKVLGTADYLAPEQAVDSHLVDARADIYSLGCTMYFLLTGHPPFTQGTLTQRLLAHQTKEPPGVETERSDVPESLLVILKQMMAKQPDDRYSDCSEVAAELANWLRNHGGGDRVPGSDKGSGKNLHLANADTDVGSEVDTNTPASGSQANEPAATPDAAVDDVQEPELGAFLARLEQAESGARPEKSSEAPTPSPHVDQTPGSDSSRVRRRKPPPRREPVSPSHAAKADSDTVVRNRSGDSQQAVESVEPPSTIVTTAPVAAGEAPVVIDMAGSGSGSGVERVVEPGSAVRRRRPRKGGNRGVLIGVAVAGVALLVIAVGYIVSRNGSGADVEPAPPPEEFHSAIGGPNDGTPEVPTNLGPEIRVGSEGDFPSLSAAIAYVVTQTDRFNAENPCTILVEGGAVFDERLVIHGSSFGGFPGGTRIASDGARAVLRPQGGEGPVIDLANTTDVTIEGFRMDAGGGDVAIRLSEYLKNTRLQDIEIEGFTGAGIHSVDAVGLPGSPLRLTNLKIHPADPKAVGIRLEDMRHAEIGGCRFTGPMAVGLEIVTTARSGDITVRDCRFHDLQTGVLFRGGESDLQEFKFINNTFHRVQRGVVLYDMPAAGSKDWEFKHNLFSEITGAEAVVERRYDDADAADPAKLLPPENAVNNWSERSPDAAGAGELDIFTTGGRRGIDPVNFESTDPEADNFLKPADRTLRTDVGTPARGAAAYIGAVPP